MLPGHQLDEQVAQRRKHQTKHDADCCVELEVSLKLRMGVLETDAQCAEEAAANQRVEDGYSRSQCVAELLVADTEKFV